MGKFSKKNQMYVNLSSSGTFLPMTLSASQVLSTGASKTVVARNLPFSMNKSDLIEFFKQAGKVVDARYKDGHYKGICYIEFATEEAANKALELDGRYLCNRDIGVGPLVESTTTGASKTLVAKNLSSSTTKSDV
ncbi:nucleolin 2-like [Papaver somniferum]|uniref:nucleolin 2-like n=1 Tax=Papaver somniferum TaxID=3469 RepID=UPI000E6FC565|nr:nucleolin 2-like [Papaver somniferum]